MVFPSAFLCRRMFFACDFDLFRYMLRQLFASKHAYLLMRRETHRRCALLVRKPRTGNGDRREYSSCGELRQETVSGA